MRYLLVLAGLAVTCLGLWSVTYGPEDGKELARTVMVCGVVAFSVGAATVDIVDAVKLALRPPKKLP